MKSRNIKLKLDRSKDPFPAERSLLLLPFIRAQPPSTSPSGAVMTSLAQVGETGAYCRSTTGIAIESVPINLHVLSKRLRKLVLATRGAFEAPSDRNISWRKTVTPNQSRMRMATLNAWGIQTGPFSDQ